MTTYDLMIKVKNELEAKGFTTNTFDDYKRYANATKDNKSERRPVAGYDFTHLYGFTVEFVVVHRHNGTSENQSVDISIFEWKASLGKRVTKERINTKMGEKAIKTRINKIADIYETL